MPDTIAPEIKPAEVLASAPHKVETPTFTGGDASKQAELTAAHERANKINEARAKNPDSFKSIISEVSSPPDFTERQLNETSDKLKTADNETRLDDITTELAPIAIYLEAVRKSQLNGSTLEAELGGDAGNVMLNTADVLIRRGGLLEKFPFLQEAYGDAESPLLKSYIESLMARDPRFQAEMAKVLTEIHKEASALESTTDDAKKSDAEKRKDPLQKLQNALLEQIKTTLHRRGLDATQQAQIEKLIEAGAQPQDILAMVKLELKMDSTFDEYHKFDESYQLHRTEEENFQAELDAEKANIDTKSGNPRRPQEIARLQGLINQARARKNSASASMMAVSSAYKLRNAGVDDAGFLAEYQKTMALSSFLKEDGPLAKTLETAIRNQSSLTAIENELKQIGENPENKALDGRKEALLKRLEASVDKATSAFLEQKYSNYVSDQNILINESIKQAEEYDKEWKAGGLKNLKVKMDKLSKYENGRYKRDSGEIATLIKDLAEKSSDGESGTRKIIAETVGFQLDPENLKNTIATEIMGSATAYSALTPENKAKADKIAETRTAQFEEIMTEHGEKFKERLFVEYNAAKGFMDKIGQGKLSLTNDQVEILNTQFSSLEKTIEKSSLFKALKEKGLVPDSKKKWIIMLLILLGGAALTAGVVPTAIAVGAAAKGIGTAAATEGLI